MYAPKDQRKLVTQVPAGNKASRQGAISIRVAIARTHYSRHMLFIKIHQTMSHDIPEMSAQIQPYLITAGVSQLSRIAAAQTNSHQLKASPSERSRRSAESTICLPCRDNSPARLCRLMFALASRSLNVGIDCGETTDRGFQWTRLIIHPK